MSYFLSHKRMKNIVFSYKYVIDLCC